MQAERQCQWLIYLNLSHKVAIEHLLYAWYCAKFLNTKWITPGPVAQGSLRSLVKDKHRTETIMQWEKFYKRCFIYNVWGADKEQLILSQRFGQRWLQKEGASGRWSFTCTKAYRCSFTWNILDTAGPWSMEGRYGEHWPEMETGNVVNSFK